MKNWYSLTITKPLSVMKITKKLRNRVRKEQVSGNRKGVALVMVLTVMALATIMILTFFGLATSENRASATYSRGLQAQQVAEQAVNLVIAQIRRATSNPTVSWASQPGALRTWTDTGAFNMGYKLYSDDLLADSNQERLNQDDYLDANRWTNRPNEFVDLNEPVIRGGRLFYPIVNPLAKHLPQWPARIGEDSDDAGIEGFDFNWDSPHSLQNGDERYKRAFHLKVAQLLKTQLSEEGGSGSIEHLPMPVRWIYQLADGTLGTMRNDRFRGFNSSTVPSEKNQIVARFAYWADDESVKLNLNTHAGGLAWDTPRCGGDADMDMGRHQPAQHEWQRYPGHPATVHISPALAPGILDIVRYRNAMEMIYATIPRVVGGGSESGTRKADFRVEEERNGLIPDKNPLYPSVDEFIMQPNRNPNHFPTAQGRPLAREKLQDALERLRFFLTTASRSPETTLFNTPRISVWPVHEDDSSEKRTEFDKLIAFCCTVGGDYFFKRKNADSNGADYYEINRNQELYRYLEKYTKEKIPGVGKSFHNKYGDAERYQILTQIFDYIRSTNLHDDTLYQEDWEDAFFTNNQSDVRTYTNPRMKNPREELLWQVGVHKGHGQVTPIRINYNNILTQGFGRFYTFKDAAIQVICCAQGHSAGADIREKFTGVKGGEQFPGWDVYRGGIEGQIGDPGAPSNIPPMHLRPEDIGDPDQFMDNRVNDYPEWIKEFLNREIPDWMQRNSNRNADPEPWNEVKSVIRPAFVPSNWNYNLLYLQDGYPEQGEGGYMSHRDWMEIAANRGSLQGMGESQIRLQQEERLLQGSFVFHLFCPSMGWVPMNPDISIEIDLPDGMEFDSENDRGKFLSDYDAEGRSIDDAPRKTWYANRRQLSWHDRHAGGVKPMSYFISPSQGKGRYTPLDPDYETKAEFDQYYWITPPFKTSGDEVTFTGGDVSFRIFPGGDRNENSEPEGNATVDKPVQELVFEMPDFTCPAPSLSGGRRGRINEFGARSSAPRPAAAMWALGRQGANFHYRIGGIDPDLGGRMANVNSRTGRFLAEADVVKSVGVLHGDVRITAATATTIEPGDTGTSGLGYIGKHWKYDENERMAHDMSLTTGWRYPGADGDGPDGDDMKLIPFQKYRGKLPSNIIGEKEIYRSELVNFYRDFDNAMGTLVDGPYINKPDEGNTHSLFNRTLRSDPNAWELRRDYGDFPYFVRDWIHESGTPSYFSPNRITNGPGMFGSLPTGVISNFPWRTLLFRPYVRSGDAYNPPEHIGNQDPKDHYIMDLFWMPVVEPYAISDSLSTGGKVNLNYQMLPFRHIKRSTALRGVFRSEFMVMIPTPTEGGQRRNMYTESYKHNSGRGRGYHWRDRPNGGFLQGKRLRSMIKEEMTLKQFQEKFDEGEIFKSASEICEMHLLPQQASERMNVSGASFKLETIDKVTVEEMEDGTYWDYHKAIADNGRERPYGNIYARTTTKSNVFKVHYRGQVLKQSRRDSSTGYAVFDEELDTVVAEYRGSSLVERYIDPNDDRIPDYATADNPPSIGIFYRFRVSNSTRFAP